MTRLRSERGFTLPELLVTMAIAMIVSLATFTLIEVVMKRSGEVGVRVETTATARTAMDQITRQLRSQVCVKTNTSSDARSLVAASPTSLSVYTDFTNEALVNGALPAPDRRQIAWAGNVFTESLTKGTRNKTTNVVDYGSAAPSVVRPFLQNVAATEFAGGDKTKPIFFRYYKFPEPVNGASTVPPNTTASVEIAANANRALTEAELLSVARISVSFTVLPRKGGPATAATTLKNDVYVRTADPNAQIPKPTCLTY
ncbi:prepilin-type N-terminal cleavage/methylation domain-containing protein [Solirubrobacter phytolaccae]|uniref:Prepilin-type N-terminal cleavage/methylation domain-containing protein n=1 Tax=Solirubrobacter phytolaccae TaxID=1404360 RepID=A0A9X3S8G1_9ACTN|nr:prepilin-type N-terminal cleavage/methylation domain-containing protein [Solirubrobacter phytolaccae]MDA0181428.1 prepilin-type N-terminal cleavage/methylation domain-containing protein [Solirubrobacter phytolaccae]